jgi:hypothetical protein
MRGVRNLLVTVMACVMALLLADSARAAGVAVNPARYCDTHFFEWETFDGRRIEAYWVPMRSTASSGSSTIGFSIESRAGCISTVAAGLRDGVVASDRFTIPATMAQCAYLEEAFGLTYPAVLYQRFHVRNRAECGQVLRDLLAVLAPPKDGPPL